MCTIGAKETINTKAFPGEKEVTPSTISLGYNQRDVKQSELKIKGDKGTQ